MTGRSKVELTHGVVLDSNTGAATLVGSLGEAEAVVTLSGGAWAALYSKEGTVKTFHPDGTPQSEHRFVGEAQFFGPQRGGDLCLLCFHKGQLLVYDLVERTASLPHPAVQDG